MKYVKIVKCSQSHWWYNNHIGEIFKVEDFLRANMDYIIMDNNTWNKAGLTIIDCIDSTEEEYLYQETGVRPIDTTTPKENYDYLIEFLTNKGIK